MVKADPKHDYYADLELPSTADNETIKKQFRILAKQYHPDRNPGKEIECIPKFQAIQAAHEVLGDPTQKKKYDAERAIETRPHEPVHSHSSYKKPTKPPPPPPSQFPPPPKRNPNPTRPSPFGASSSRPTSSASAEKFAQFARQAPQTWDRPKFEEAAKAETLRNLHNMRPQSQGPPPRVPPRAAPTAPRPPSTGPSPDMSHASGPSPGFPGLSRTNSARRSGFTTNTGGNDEPPAPSSAYAHVHRPPPPPPAASYAHPSMAASPPSQRPRSSASPLRQTKSSGFEDAQRPGLYRSSSRYAERTGERTDIRSPDIARSASTRNSPTGTRWDESGPFGGRPQHQTGHMGPPPRHHSSSPRGRFAAPGHQYSASESSSTDDDEPPRNEARSRPTPRKPVPPSGRTNRAFSENDPALTGQFPSSNYNTKITDDKQYHYPPPEPRTSVTGASTSVDDITQGLNSSGIRHVHRDDVPLNNSQSSQRPNGMSSEPQSAATNTGPTFSAAEWDGKFAANGDNVFRPTESTSRSRSPTKSRPKLPNRNRGDTRSQNERHDEGDANNGATAKMPGVRHVAGMADGLSKAAAFQAGSFSAEDWSEKLRSQAAGTTPKVPPRETPGSSTQAPKQSQAHDEVEVEEHASSPEQHAQPPQHTVGPDAMDVDETVPQQTPTAKHLNPGPTLPGRHSRRSSTSDVNLNNLRETAPFRPAALGLDDLDDLNNTLPFESRAAEELNLRQPPSSGHAAHHLNLPKPPKPVIPPDEQRLTQESWGKYSEKITRYMDEWNIFNCKMIDHFRLRQQQIGLAMYHNWVTAVGDGASADDFDGLDFVGSTGQTNGIGSSPQKPKKAGYATYMQWLEQDQVCRTWWDVALDEHKSCMEDLGRVRKVVKAIRDR